MPAKKKTCTGKTRAGKRCGASPLKPGTVIDGVTVKGKHCRAHDPDLPASTRFGSRAQATQAGMRGGRPRMPSPSEIARRLIEQNELALQRPYWLTLGYDAVIGPDGPELREIRNGGAKLFGTSKDGVVKVSRHKDLEAMQRAAERLQDRVYGRPKQTSEITGADGGPVEMVPVTRDRGDEVVRILMGTGSLPVPVPNGNGTGNGHN